MKAVNDFKIAGQPFKFVAAKTQNSKLHKNKGAFTPESGMILFKMPKTVDNVQKFMKDKGENHAKLGLSEGETVTIMCPVPSGRPVCGHPGASSGRDSIFSDQEAFLS